MANPDREGGVIESQTPSLTLRVSQILRSLTLPARLRLASRAAADCSSARTRRAARDDLVVPAHPHRREFHPAVADDHPPRRSSGTPLARLTRHFVATSRTDIASERSRSFPPPAQKAESVDARSAGISNHRLLRSREPVVIMTVDRDFFPRRRRTGRAAGTTPMTRPRGGREPRVPPGRPPLPRRRRPAGAGDGELLRRFAGGDDGAFAELVRRHGRLVWAVCRHLTGSDADADDAFQATFLVLLQNAGKVRDAGRLSAWLHGVAYKVCAKARRPRSGGRPASRPRPSSERNGSAVPDSAWDRALAAVHEEVGQAARDAPRAVRAVLPRRQGGDGGGRATRVEARHVLRPADPGEGRRPGAAGRPRADPRGGGRVSGWRDPPAAAVASGGRLAGPGRGPGFDSPTHSRE